MTSKKCERIYRLRYRNNSRCTRRQYEGFTLIELSIVLIIIGLIVGGVLIGRVLISAAAVRAQISQIEKYQQAVNAFISKYGYLPGDIPDPEATKFGFIARGSGAGQGDGDGIISGHCASCGTSVQGEWMQGGNEPGVFWVDLSTAKLIGSSFSAANETTLPAATVTFSTTPSVRAYIPEAAIGNGNYVYVYSGGTSQVTSDGNNYYGISNVSSIVHAAGGDSIASDPGMKVADAKAIDDKIDDGFPQSGRVQAFYMDVNVSWSPGAVGWAGGGHGSYGASTGSTNFAPTTVATSASSTTCYDNGGVSGSMRYSITTNNGMGVNCALSIKFQ